MTKRTILHSFLRKNRAAVGGAIALGMMANCMVIILPVSLGKYFDLLFGFNSHRSHFLDLFAFSFWDDMPSFLVFFFVLVALRTVFYFSQRFMTGILGERFARQLRELLFERQLLIKTTVYDDKGTGKYLLRYSGDLKSLQRYLTRGIIQFSVDVILLSVAVLFLAWLDGYILGVAAAGFTITGVVIYGFNKLLYRVSVRRRNNRSRMLSFVHERLLAISTIKAFNKEVPERKKFAKHSARLYDSGLKFQAIYSFIYTLVPGMSYMVLGLVLLVIFTLKDGGAGIDSGAMLSFILLFITVLPVFRRTMRVHTVWEVGNISFEKLLRVIALEPDQQHRKKFRFRTGEIVLENLGFGFLGKRPLFAGLNLRFRPGHITVARAQRGAGKTTLIKLMTGIYTPQKGRLLIDGQSLEQVDLKSLRRHVATVSEAFPLLGKTVFEAISYSRAPEKKTAAAKVLNTLQQGVPVAMRLRLDDKTGYQGRLLSAGQRKVLLYARAMLTGKPVLLVDEPFGGLPPDVRAQVTRWFLHKKRSGTIVLFTSEWNDDWLRPNAVAGLGAPQNNSTDTPEKGTSPAGNGEKTLAS